MKRLQNDCFFGDAFEFDFSVRLHRFQISEVTESTVHLLVRLKTRLITY